MSDVARGIGQSNTGPSGPQGSGGPAGGLESPQGARHSTHPQIFSSCSLQGPKHLAECELGVGRGAGS